MADKKFEDLILIVNEKLTIIIMKVLTYPCNNHHDEMRSELKINVHFQLRSG